MSSLSISFKCNHCSFLLLLLSSLQCTHAYSTSVFLSFSFFVVLFLVPCFSFSHLCVFLWVGFFIHVAVWGHQLLMKLLPPLCKKTRRAVVAVSFCFSWGPKGEAWSGSCSSFWGQLHRKYLGRGGIALSLLVSRACVHNLSAGYGKCWLLAYIMQGSANCNAHLGKYCGGKVERGPAHPFLQCLYELLGNQFLLMWAFRKS